MYCKEICMNGIVVGRATININGLYAHFKCVCHFSNKRIYAVYLRSGAADRLLGTCIPQKGAYVLETKIPKKHVSESDCILYAAEKNENIAAQSRSITLVSGEPTEVICMLDKTRFRADGEKYMLFVIDEA